MLPDGRGGGGEGANAIIAMRFDTSERAAVDGDCAYGTAVRVHKT